MRWAGLAEMAPMLSEAEIRFEKQRRFVGLLLGPVLFGLALMGPPLEHVTPLGMRKLAPRFDSNVLLLAVPEKSEETSELEKYLDMVATALRDKGLEAETRVTGSNAAQSIVDVAETEGADLIMMATKGQGSFARRMMIGSVAYNVIRSTPCPVFLVPVRKKQHQAKDARLPS
ncbi:MAG: hypothetical protein A3H27_11070 [Acidobacteria bacterium RIFCSPLOWO2_02_FULL_59_13]|nr:MAG: hypothetical protein A3H27_11070 [Acidobacteria bacterium RIFCSPLOWO2_02_FULL_59_13]